MSVGPQRIAVTGVGLVSALGRNAHTTFSRLVSGERAFAPVTLFDAATQRSSIVAEVSGLTVADVAVGAERDAWSRSDALGVMAAREAMQQAGFPEGCGNLGVALGATTGGTYEAEGAFGSMQRGLASEAALRRLLSFPLSATVRRITGVVAGVSRTTTLCSACSSGAIAIAQGAAWLELGLVERALVGGVDGLCLLTVTGFNALAATALEACRPFDVARAGLTLGEGAGFLVLEPESSARQRHANVLAWLTGWAAAAEAHHITQPEPSGATAAGLLRAAMQSAGLCAEQVDYVNAHGTGTVHNDAMEARALEQVFGAELERVYISSSKGQLGHTLGAAGAVEAAITVLSVEQGVVPPTGGLERADPALPMRHVVGIGQRASIRAALSSSFGFGGTGCVLAFERSDAGDRRAARIRQPLAVSAVVTFGPYGTQRGAMAARALAPVFFAPDGAPDRIERDPVGALDPTRSRRFDRTTALVVLGAQSLLRDAGGLEPARVGLCVGTAFGNAQRSLDFLARIADKGPAFASPAEFPHLLPSAPSGNASIYLGITGPVATTPELDTSAEAAVATACDWLSSGLAEAGIGGSAELHDDFVDRLLSPPYARTARSHRAEGAAWLLVETAKFATERGAPIMAWVRRYGQCVPAEERVTALGAPDKPERALVVVAGDLLRCDRLLRGCSWASIERRSVQSNAGTHEGAGGFALAAGVALVAGGSADDVLVLSCGTDQTHWFWFARSPGSEQPGSLVRGGGR
ncbi:MAG: beta-ketoacyl-[acyl-carrier-protein] synthase family protein [Polyangiaceae bacterium]|nr:beta-ketoacyl-[acyl-carrier-protein] synthase family protein [Polyangiaceae bacterium]